MGYMIIYLMQTKPARSMVLPRMVVTGPGVLEQIPAIIAELDIPERGLIVCDTNTLDIAGNQVIDYLEAGGHPMQKVEIKGANIEELERVEAFSKDIDFLVGLGGGRPIDIAKQAGFNKNIPRPDFLKYLKEIPFPRALSDLEAPPKGAPRPFLKHFKIIKPRERSFNILHKK